MADLSSEFRLTRNGVVFRETSAEGKFVLAFVLVLVLDCVRNSPGLPENAGGDKDESENKNAFIFRKSKMKASTNPAENSSAGWPHPSLCGEVGSWLIVFG